MQISSATTLAASEDAPPLDGRRFGSRLILFAILLAVILTTGGWLYYRHQYAEAHEAMQKSLASIADLKSEDIRNWIHERRGDAEVARYSRAMQDALSHPADAAVRSQISQIVSIFRNVYDYGAIVVTDQSGEVQLTDSDHFAVPASAIADHVKLAVNSRKVEISFLTQMRPDEPRYFWVSCPIFRSGDAAGGPIGTVLLVADPRTFLYPTVQRWPVLVGTAKSFLVLRKDGQVTGLSDSIGPAKEASAGQTPGSQTKSTRPTLAALALQGTEGVFEASDPQGVPLFAAVRNIPGTPWLILVTISQDEILAPVRWDAWNAGIISVLLVLATALGLGLYWRQQKLRYVGRELEERRRAEAALTASESRFRLLIENASDIITVVSMDYIMRFVSPSAKRCLGYQPEELLDRSVLDLTHPDDVQNISAAFAKLTKNPGESVSAEYRFRHRDGSWRVLQSVGRVLPDQDKDALVVVNSRDITENRVLQRQFQQAQKMESIGQLAGGIAHDFNNFLSIIIGYGELLQLELPPDAKTTKRCEEIQKAGYSAASLTRQLLAYSRQQVLEPRVLDLNATVASMGKMLQRLIGADIECTNELDRALRPIKADPGQLEQVIMNLVVNARDAMPQGGKLTIATANIDFDDDLARAHRPATPGPYVVLSVTDTGSGMDARTQARIFEPFFTTKEQGKGTGLGLATVYGIVKQSGGYIWVYSEPGYGTTFKLYFPVTGEAAYDAKLSPVSSESWRGTETVLVVEDQDAIRELVRSFLAENGYAVLQAASSEDAMKIASERRGAIDLLLTDLVMPGKNGRILAKELGAAFPAIKVIYMSGYAGLVHRDTLDASDVLINKPFTRATLLQKVREVLESRPAFQLR